MRRVISIALALVAGAVFPALAAGPDSNLGAYVNGGGCYPQPLTGSLISMLQLVNPEWAPVINGPVIDSTPVLVHGTVNDVHGQLGGDFPVTHSSSDMVAELTADPADADKVATGNGGSIALEWESRMLPPFVWPGVGDEAIALGRWIFDCGHPDTIPGHCSTTVAQQCVDPTDCAHPGCPSCVSGETCVGANYRYSSEIHPPHAIASIRQGRGAKLSNRAGAPPIPVTRADIYVSANAGGAGDRCVLTHTADFNTLLTSAIECYPLSQPVAQINAQDFTFDVPLPPKPLGARFIKKKLIKYPVPEGGKRASIRIQKFLDDPQPHLTVTVKMAGRRNPTDFAGTLFVGWKQDPTPLTHVRVTLESLVVNNPVRATALVSPKTCSTANTPCNDFHDCPSGELCLGVGLVKGWYMDAEVNGEWQRLTGLDSVDAGQEIPQSLVYDQYLPATGQVELIAKGKSQECIDFMYGKSVYTDLLEQGLTKGSQCLFSVPREVGDFDVAYAGPDFGAGGGGSMEYDVGSVGGQGGHCSSTTGTLCVGNADCPMGEMCVLTDGSFDVKYRIERLP